METHYFFLKLIKNTIKKKSLNKTTTHRRTALPRGDGLALSYFSARCGVSPSALLLRKIPEVP